VLALVTHGSVRSRHGFLDSINPFCNCHTNSIENTTFCIAPISPMKELFSLTISDRWSSSAKFYFYVQAIFVWYLKLHNRRGL